MIEKYISAENGTVFYWISEDWEEDRNTMFFLHGLTGNHTMFEKQVEYFKGKFNLIVWDAPAHGKSRPYSSFSYPNSVEVLHSILSENKVKSVIMIGQSFGGFVSQSFLLRYPEMVTAFIGIDTTPYGSRYYSKSDKWWLRQIEWMSYCYPLKAMKKAISKQVSATKESYQNMLSMIESYGKKELCHLLGIGYGGFLEDNRDLQINCPVLLLLGDKDKLGKVQQYNQDWHKNTGFPLKVIENASHNSNYDNPTAVNKEIEAFINIL